ncbi:DUF2283 domain-containing protein [Persephonella sp.]|uniref:DUF2283 domain-containing protein n=1 Tax=Persephonella sp. TaxID=2060922 RepID=UPI0025F044E6|nr:DUF2283 domain-containing protein [Persephonella sp.]
MKFKYYPETDTLYIEVKSIPSVESEEILEGIVLDYDEDGNIVGIEIEGIKNLKNLNLPIKASFEFSQSSQ